MILICQNGCSETHTGCMWTQMHKPGHTKHVGFVIPEALQHKGSFRIRTNRNTNAPTGTTVWHQQCVCTLPQAGLWVPAVGRLVLRLLYLCLKGAAPMELRPQSAGRAGLGPQGFQGVGAMQRTPFVTGWVARGGGTDVGWGDRGKKKWVMLWVILH